MKKLIMTLVAAFVLAPTFAFANAGGHLEHAGNDLTDKASLQRGFKAYIDNCLGCHELQYQRYNRTFADLGISDEDGLANWMYTGEKVGDHITNTMPKKEAAKWFGSTPPDLTLEARLRSPDWIYTYLRAFYTDPARPFGVNNKVFKDVGMPHVLQNLQGIRSIDEHGNLGPATGGSMTEEEYDNYIRDMVNFFEYVGEPSKLEREGIGYWVLGYLIILFIFTYFLKKEFWKDVH
jgi:ubiquinol-cytochrome c reductase cytochrome c1 subunit